MALPGTYRLMLAEHAAQARLFSVFVIKEIRVNPCNPCSNKTLMQSSLNRD